MNFSLRKVLWWGRFRKPKRRSVVFYRNSYYHFKYLAEALRRRGWDAITVSLEDPNGPNAMFYHGEDVNLYDPDHEVMTDNIAQFFEMAKKRFRLMHFAGDGTMSFFQTMTPLPDPPDIIEWKNTGHFVAYTASGCNSAIAQTTVRNWSLLDAKVPVCDRCVWQLRPDVCNDQKNLAWGKKLEKYCDIVFGETLDKLDYMAMDKVIHDPVTTCLDPNIWSPNLRIPKKFKVPKAPGEVLIFHSVGNYDSRNVGGRNIKGTPFIVAAVERLRSEGHPVRLMFFTTLRNLEIRFMQLQADIVVDQLHVGQYGANARESMMLGKPTISYVHKKPKGSFPEWLKECPLVGANEENIYEVLKGLVIDQGLRREIGLKSREYALKWHSADACAIRYENIVEQFISNNDHKIPARPKSALTDFSPSP